MEKPSFLYRYRAINSSTIGREIDALRDGYIYASPFSLMNDPMEAFYEVEKQNNLLEPFMTPESRVMLSNVYDQLSELFRVFALISFSIRHDNLPMWAYYGGNFGGICLEFDARLLEVGDLRMERLSKVNYAENALPPLSMIDFSRERMDRSLIARLSHKRIEWSHEKEWRYITGREGKKFYIDDAISRIYLGPRINNEYKNMIIEIFRRRPTEILIGEVSGFHLSFDTIKERRSFDICERIGSGVFDEYNDLLPVQEFESFLKVPVANLVAKCRDITQHPNMERFGGIGVSGSVKDAMYMHVVYKLRSGSEAYKKIMLDRHLNCLPEN